MPTPTGSPETPEPAQRAGSGRSGGRRDRTQHDRRHGEDVVSDEPDSQGETLARARGDSRGQRRVRFGQVRGFVGCNSFANVMRGLLLAATAMLVLSMPATEVKAQTVGICSRALAVQTPILAATSRTACSDVTTADLASVTTLSVTAYGPTSIDPADFAGLTGLTSLWMRASPQLTTVPDNAFAGLTALTSLDFNFLSLTTLGEDAFDGLTALATLNLQFTGLTALHADIFDGLTALDNLTLSNNGLTTLDADIFDGLTALRILALNSNSPDDSGRGHLRRPHRPGRARAARRRQRLAHGPVVRRREPLAARERPGRRRRGLRLRPRQRRAGRGARPAAPVSARQSAAARAGTV